MQIIRRVILSLVPFFIVLAVLLSRPEAKQGPAALAGRSPAAAQPDQPEAAQEQALYLGEPVTPGLSPAVRDLPQQPPEPQLEREVVPRQLPLLELPLDSGTGEDQPDPLLARTPANLGASPAPLFTSEGLSGPEGGYYLPPDTIGDVGPNHYVQMVNAAFAIFDKSGNRLTGPVAFNTLFEANAATPNCDVANDGDPVVVYDALADRWLLSQFFGIGLSQKGFCVAVSQTPDPTGAYFLYEFITPEFPDYFKIGAWPDAYYVSANESSYTAYAFDRNEMLAGNAASFQRITGQSNLLLPADLDGAMPPPAGAPGLFYTFKDNVSHGGSDRLEVFAFDVDWNNSTNTTFTPIASIDIAPFTYTVCGFFIFDCVPQLGTTQRVDSISEWPMWRLQYRNFGTYETLAGNFTVDVGTDQAGIRWFELRRAGGNWTLHQEGTHAPDSHHRWLGSIAMNGKGDIALGYSVSSATLAPSIRYAGRQGNDPLASLQSEATLQAGSGAQTTGSSGSNRWGDYSALVVDPADDCTFWYTNQYYADISLAWRTRVGVFKLSDCAPDLLSPTNGELLSNPMPTLDWDSVPSAVEYQLQVDDNGNFNSPEVDVLGSSSDYTLAGPLAEDTHYWRVRARDYAATWGAWSSEWSFEIDTPPEPPTLVSPADGEVISDTTPILMWTSSAGASGYRLALDGVVTDVGSITQVTTAALSEGVHDWTVAAYDAAGNLSAFAATWSFELDVVGPGSPILVSPANGALISDTVPTLDWDALTGAVEYRLQVDDDASFGSPEVDVLGSTTDYTPAGPLAEDTHYWRVRARDNTATWGAWSSEWSFEIDVTPPDAPTLVSPADGAATEDTAPLFDWSAVTGGYLYRIQISDTPTFNSTLFTKELSATLFLPGSSLAAGAYYWRVQARDAVGNWGDWSPTWSVAVGAQPDFRIHLPLVVNAP